MIAPQWLLLQFRAAYRNLNNGFLITQFIIPKPYKGLLQNHQNSQPSLNHSSAIWWWTYSNSQKYSSLLSPRDAEKKKQNFKP